jgi:hypothetical protein
LAASWTFKITICDFDRLKSQTVLQIRQKSHEFNAVNIMS